METPTSVPANIAADAAAVDNVLAQAAAENNKMGKVLQHAVKIVRVGLQGGVGYRKVDDARVFIDDKEQDKETFTTPSIRVMPKEWNSKFAAVLNKALLIIREYAPKNSDDLFPLPGCLVVLASKIDELEEKINKLIETDMIPLVNSFVAIYPSLIEKVKPKLSEKQLASLPTAEEIKSKLKLVFFKVPITFLDQAGKEMADAVVQSTINGLSKELADRVDHLLEIVDKDKGNLRKQSIDNVKLVFQKMRDFSFVTSPEVAEKLKNAETHFAGLGADAHTMLNEAIREKQTSIVNGLKQVLTDLTKEVKTDAGGRFRRKINV